MAWEVASRASRILALALTKLSTISEVHLLSGKYIVLPSTTIMIL
jgi:hypothetical protein